ncbi:MAG TPA: hypothetical protein VIK72_19160 [Clostridiaceae bacterium]
MSSTYAQKITQQTAVANSELNPAYNMKVTALKNSLAASTLALTNSKTGINQSYDTQVTNQNISNVSNKNSLDTSNLSKGIGRSSIALTGLAEQDQINNRYIAAIKQNRTGALNTVDSSIAQANIDYNANVANLGADKLDSANTMAHDYADKQVAQEYQAGRDSVADSEWNTTNNYNIGRDKVADAQYATTQSTDNSRYKDAQLTAAQALKTANDRYNAQAIIDSTAVKTDNQRYADSLKKSLASK